MATHLGQELPAEEDQDGVPEDAHLPLGGRRVTDDRGSHGLEDRGLLKG